ncbi:MAG: hypothetical protein GXP49_08955 [Deltaproteobacteria bacterium]|nr:hypothetical protein [Deltaproteobacteria bacterium]
MKETKRGKLIALLVTVMMLVVGAVAAVSWAQSTKVIPSQVNHAMEVVGLSEDSLVTIKDHGDSQTIMVFMVNKEGKVKLTDKKKFFY